MPDFLFILRWWISQSETLLLSVSFNYEQAAEERRNLSILLVAVNLTLFLVRSFGSPLVRFDQDAQGRFSVSPIVHGSLRDRPCV